MSRNAIFALLAALALAAASGCDSFFGHRYDPDSEGTIENPIEIGHEVHRGTVGVMASKYSGSYYTFLSDVEHPQIYYTRCIPRGDLDCDVYTEPDFDNGEVKWEQGGWEDHCSVNTGDFTGVRLYVHIKNYLDLDVIEYDIYYQ